MEAAEGQAPSAVAPRHTLKESDMDHKRIQDLIERAKLAADEDAEQGLFKRAETYVRERPAAFSALGAGSVAALAAYLLSDRNKVSKALTAGALGAGAGYAVNAYAAEDKRSRKQTSLEKRMRQLRRRDPVKEVEWETLKNLPGEVKNTVKERLDAAKKTTGKASDAVAPHVVSLRRDIKNIPRDIKRKGRTAGDALDTLAAWAGFIKGRKNIARMQNELANPGWEARRQERLERQRAQKELRERRAQGR